MKARKKIWVSVDGGGTKTMFCAGDSAGNTLYTGTSGRSNYKSAGIEVTADSIQKGFTTMLKSLNNTWEDVVGVVMAVAGCDTKQDLLVYRKMMEDLGYPVEKIFICNDTESIFRAMTDEKGICVVAGTGSIVCAYDENGQAGRTGGWGPNVSDLGSGYWIGSEILRRMICWLDGIETEELPIYHTIAERFQKDDIELAWLLAGLSVFEIASISKQVFQYADEGDQTCKKIVKKAAEWIVQQIVVLCKKMDYNQAFPIVAVGGLFNNKEFFDLVKNGVNQRLFPVEARFILPVNSPAEDGLCYARKLYSI